MERWQEWRSLSPVPNTLSMSTPGSSCHSKEPKSGAVLLLQPFPLSFSFRMQSAQTCLLLVAMTCVSCACVFHAHFLPLRQGFPLKPQLALSVPLSALGSEAQSHTQLSIWVPGSDLRLIYLNSKSVTQCTILQPCEGFSSSHWGM